MAFEKVGVRAVVEGLGAFNRGMRQIDRGLKAAGVAAKATKRKPKI